MPSPQEVGFDLGTKLNNLTSRRELLEIMGLIREGVDANTQGKNGETYLHHLCSSLKTSGDESMFTTILQNSIRELVTKYNADIHLKDFNGLTPFQILMNNPTSDITLLEDLFLENSKKARADVIKQIENEINRLKTENANSSSTIFSPHKNNSEKIAALTELKANIKNTNINLPIQPLFEKGSKASNVLEIASNNPTKTLLLSFRANSYLDARPAIDPIFKNERLALVNAEKDDENFLHNSL